jgi:P-type Cu+ transporter
MSETAISETADQLWSEEPSSRPGHRKIRARIGGLHCSLCTGTIEKALARLPGVDKVAVSLTHEQALVEYDAGVVRPDQVLRTLRDIGYTIHDPRKLRAFDEEECDLVREARRFVAAVALSVAAIPIIADPEVGWVGFLPALVCLSLGGFVFLVLRSSGLWTAIGAAGGLAIMALALLDLNLHGYLTDAAPWLTGALALVLVLGVARHILYMSVQALRRGILNQPAWLPDRAVLRRRGDDRHLSHLFGMAVADRQDAQLTSGETPP